MFINLVITSIKTFVNNILILKAFLNCSLRQAFIRLIKPHFIIQREKDRERKIERDRERETEKERQRKRDREREKERKREKDR